MKKKLICLLSLLSLPLYATNENIKNEENQIGENLKVDVKFTLPKEIIKYVVFASKDNGKIMEDTLKLPNFIMSQDVAKAGFVEDPPKVYVKRVVDGKISELTNTDKITYILEHTDGFMPNVLNDTINEGSTSYRQITSYLPKTTLDDIVKNSGINGYSVSDNGSIIKTGASEAYFPAAQINMFNNNGVLETTSPSNKYPYPIPKEDREKIESYIGSGKEIGNVSLKVKVE